jgi:hypothetical protein
MKFNKNSLFSLKKNISASFARPHTTSIASHSSLNTESMSFVPQSIKDNKSVLDAANNIKKSLVAFGFIPDLKDTAVSSTRFKKSKPAFVGLQSPNISSIPLDKEPNSIREFSEKNIDKFLEIQSRKASKEYNHTPYNKSKKPSSGISL